jgi:hypothetical protein
MVNLVLLGAERREVLEEQPESSELTMGKRTEFERFRKSMDC